MSFRFVQVINFDLKKPKAANETKSEMHNFTQNGSKR
jgi:hypothetical protein